MRYVYPHALLMIDGVAYKWSGWFGCQLESWEWRRVPAGTRRALKLDRRQWEITVFRTDQRRRWTYFKVVTLWTISLRGGTDDMNAQLREFREALRQLV